MARLLPNRDKFLKNVKDTRNKFSHADQQPEAISTGLMLLDYNQRMTILVQICFLRQMGLSTDQITQLILQNREFNFVTGKRN